MLTNIRIIDDTIFFGGVGGKLDINMMGDLPGLPQNTIILNASQISYVSTT
jgi:hypothetical protein